MILLYRIMGIPISGLRVLRGGSWNNNPNRLRSAYRNNNTPDNRNNNNGFRLVCYLTLIAFPKLANTDDYGFQGTAEVRKWRGTIQPAY